MTKSVSKFFVLTATLILLSLMAAVIWAGGAAPVNAQRTTSHVFQGKVILNGQPAPDDTRVIGYIDGIRISEKRTKDGRFSMKVWQPLAVAGKTVEFRGASVDRKELRFPQTASWEPGGETVITLELLGDLPTIDAEEQQTHVFQGSVVLDGQPISDESNLQAYADGIRMRSVKIKGGRYRMEVRQPASFNGRTVEFRGGGVRFPQIGVWTAAGSTINLQYPSAPDNQHPPPLPGSSSSISEALDGLDIGCVLRVLGRIPAGPQDMSPSETFRVARECVTGSSRSNEQARLEQAHLEQERAFQQEQQRLEAERLKQEQLFRQGQQRLETERIRQQSALQADQQRLDEEQSRREQERIKREQALQEAQDRLDRDQLKTARERQEEQARLNVERRAQEQERINAELASASEQKRLDQRRLIEEQQRQEELEKIRFENERARIERDRVLEEERARLEQERLQREDERLRRESSEGQPTEIKNSNQPPGDDPAQSGPARGFFTNTRLGGLGAANQLMDPTMIAVIGILITMGATLMQMVKGS